MALHRYLRWRQPGYDPEQHLGGVLYLFLRGMCGPETPVADGVPYGVFSWSPPAALVTDLSDLLHRGRRRDGRGRESVERALRAEGQLAPEFNRAGVLTSADVHVARRLQRLCGENDERVLLAAALAVRAVRHGSVVLELGDVAQRVATDGLTVDGCPSVAGR